LQLLVRKGHLSGLDLISPAKLSKKGATAATGNKIRKKRGVSDSAFPASSVDFADEDENGQEDDTSKKECNFSPLVQQFRKASCDSAIKASD
jgi:hypothetical protein